MCERGPRHQYRKNDRHEEERRHVCYQMAAFGWIMEGLRGHDRAVNHARPHGKPDDAPVRIGISRSDEQKYAQRRINSDNHQQIVRMSLAPDPARRPHNAQRIYAEYERQTDDDEGDAEKEQAVCIGHICVSRTHIRIKLFMRLDAKGNPKDFAESLICS
jgi:hypothetical protein